MANGSPFTFAAASKGELMRRIPVPAQLLSDAAQGSLLRLPDKEAHYVVNVLRRPDQSELELFCGDGKLASGTLQITDAGVFFKIHRIEESAQGESPLQITLFQAIPKGKRWEWILEKASELGVSTIIPLHTTRSVVKIPAARASQKLVRWQNIVATAARQCERAHIPQVAAPLSIQEAIESNELDLHLVAHTRQDAPSPLRVLKSAPAPLRSLGIWIGPEGGFTDQEFKTLQDAGAHPISLGPRILRADTAPIVALTLAQAAAGDL